MELRADNSEIGARLLLDLRQGSKNGIIERNKELSDLTEQAISHLKTNNRLSQAEILLYNKENVSQNQTKQRLSF